jgi:hypothetical protein
MNKKKFFKQSKANKQTKQKTLHKKELVKLLEV